MPTYSYRCNTCKYEFEAKQHMADEPLKSCPECKKNIVRLIGKDISINFKGSGFYVNDSKKNKS